MEKFEADTPIHIGNMEEAEAAFQAQLLAALKGAPNGPIFVTPGAVGTPCHVDYGKVADSGLRSSGKPNRAQRRAEKHKK